MLWSFSIWDWSQIIGTLLVVIGVAGELVLLIKKFRYNPTNFPPVESLKRKLEILSVVILLIGLVLEVVALPHSLLQAAKLEQSNLELQARLQHRNITPENEEKFIKLLEHTPKSPIRLFCLSSDKEAYEYTKQVRKMLDKSGYGVSGNNDSGFSVDMGYHVNYRGISTNGTPSVFLAIGSINVIDYMPVIQKAFQAIGIEAPFILASEKNNIKPDELVVFVTDRF